MDLPTTAAAHCRPSKQGDPSFLEGLLAPHRGRCLPAWAFLTPAWDLPGTLLDLVLVLGDLQAMSK